MRVSGENAQCAYPSAPQNRSERKGRASLGARERILKDLEKCALQSCRNAWRSDEFDG
jgi:hypothetical protein